jgi:DNA-binding NarL/FixJ family response regulator
MGDATRCEHARGPAEPPVRVVVVDDNDLVRDGLAGLLAVQGDFEVIGTAANGAEGIAAIAELQPDVVLMDISMPVMDGLTATRTLRASGTAVRVLIVTGEVAGAGPAALAAGADGFVEKSAGPDALLYCLRAVAAGCDCCRDPLGRGNRAVG